MAALQFPRDHQAEVLVGSVSRRPPTQYFTTPITKDSLIAPAAGVASAIAMSRFGRIHIPEDRVIQHCHFHYDHPGGTGTYRLELWRLRGTLTRIATVSATGSLGDFGTFSFVFANPQAQTLLAGDYLLLQVTSATSGQQAKDAVGTVDVHFAPIIYPVF